jgi:hypothetical protein
MAQAVEEILAYMEKLVEESDMLTKKEQGATPPKSIN